ncbi:MAG TPA: PQQ-binding-like beta-propeller repeat protein [Pirellulales bacterium]|jgi:outer membrane protein assembly factor BamB
MNRTNSIRLLAAALLLAWAAPALRAQSTEVPLVGQFQAEQLGLKRAWFTQLPVDGLHSKVTHLKYQSGLLLAVTDSAMLYVVDAETGALRWSFRIGDRKFGAMAAGANATNVAVANIGRVFILDRATGNVIFDHALTGTPARGPVLTEKHVIVPLANGPLEVYALDALNKDFIDAYYLESAGRLIGEVIADDVSVLWTGNSNVFHAHEFGDVGSQFRTDIPAGVSSGPGVYPPHAYLGTMAGYLIAYDAHHGEIEWKFASGSPISHKPIGLGTAVYALPEDGGLYSIAPDTGEGNWFAPDPTQFIAASPNRIYAIDKFKRMEILDVKTGARIDGLNIPLTLKALVNDQSDRLYFYTDAGLLQCVHEAQLTDPHWYKPPKEAPAKNGPDAKPADAAAAPDAVAAPAAGAAAPAAAPDPGAAPMPGG